ncbi:MAG: hypothetical protein ACF8PN_04865 [Phycisphaerales bacterium]
MTPKGINFIELHVEKIVLGVAGLIVVGLVARQLLTDPNAVTIDGRTVSPGEVDEVLEEKADRLKSNLDSGRRLEIEEVALVSDWFDRRLTDPVVDDRSEVALVRPALLKVGNEDISVTGGGEYAAFVPPTPTDLVVTKHSYTLDPEIVSETPDLAAMLPNEPPYDLTAVHVMAEIDGTAIRDALMTPQQELRAIPSAWWEREMAMLDIVVERQKRQSDGDWGDIEIVQTIPGQVTFRDEFGDLRSTEVSEFISNVYAAGDQVYRPGFFRLSTGDEWSVKILEEAGPMDPEVEEAVLRMQRAWARVERAEESLDRFLRSQDRERDRNREMERGGGEGRGGGTEGGGGEGAGGRGQDPDRSREDRAATVQGKLEDDLQAERDLYNQMKDEVLALDPDFTDFPDADATELQRGGRGGERGLPGGEGREAPSEFTGEGGGPGLGGEGAPGLGGEGATPRGRGTGERGGERGGRRSAEPTLFEQESVKVWAHDINLDPGATYRYRLRVAMYNPFFGRGDRLSEGQREWADSVTIESEPTEWSEPVRITDQTQYFAIEGRYRDSIEDRSATFEVYTFTSGEYRVTTVTAKPGDPIGEIKTIRNDAGEPVAVDFATGAVLLDVVDVSAGDQTLNRRTKVLVGMPDGSIVSVDPEEERSDAERGRLRELAARP